MRTWDKPAAACLASRIPYGTPVTFRTSHRCRPGGVGAATGSASANCASATTTTLARIEVELADFADIVARRAEVVDAVKSAGYRYVTLDLEGFRSGNLNGCARSAVVATASSAGRSGSYGTEYEAGR